VKEETKGAFMDAMVKLTRVRSWRSPKHGASMFASEVSKITVKLDCTF
jgi:hypothetical protein